MIEKILFNVCALTFFIIVFIKLIKQNDSNYLYLLAIQFLGILINYIELIIGEKFNIFLKAIEYIMAIAIPIMVIIIEKTKKISFNEIVNILMFEVCEALGIKESEKFLKNLIKRNENSKIGHVKLANFYIKVNKEHKALEELEKVIIIDEKDIKSYKELGLLYEKFGNTKSAEAVFIDILNEEPQNYEVSVILADMYFKEEKYKESALIYSSALRYKNNDYDLYYNLGMTYSMLNDFNRAKECYENAAKINASNYNAKYFLGQLSMMYENFNAATEYFEKCTESELFESESYYYLSKISIIKGEIDNAINYANAAVEENFEVYDEIQKDYTFIKIKDKIKRPKEIRKVNKIKEKEKIVENHLNDTSTLIKNLSKNENEKNTNQKKEIIEKEEHEIK